MNSLHAINSHMPRASSHSPQKGPTLTQLIADHWKGRHGLVASAVVPSIALLLLWGVFTLVWDRVDWVWHYELASVATLLVIVLLVAVSVWGVVGVAASAKRLDNFGAYRVWSHCACGLVMTCALSTTGQFGFKTREWLAYLITVATDKSRGITVTLAYRPDRLVIRGQFGIGVTKHVRDQLARTPWVRLVELDSPGGVAREGLALAHLLEDKSVDTLVLRDCSSACVTAFAGGTRRFLGPSGRLGLHASRPGFRPERYDLDAAHAQLLERRGVARWLTEAEAATPSDDLLRPGPNTLIAAGLVTGMWKEP